MAFALLSHEVSDLTLGKPALSWLASSSSVRDALLALKLRADDSELSVWDCSHPLPSPLDALPAAAASSGSAAAASSWNSRLRRSECQCIGKICMQKIICYLATDESLSDPAKALDAPVSTLLTEPTRTVQHIESDAGLVEALDLIASGAQNLVVRIGGHANKYGRYSRGSTSQKTLVPSHALLPQSHNGREYCWLTQEDVLRFLIGSISVFSPLPMMSIENLGIIKTDVLMVGVEEEAISALEMIKAACQRMTAVAVVDNIDEGHGPFKLVGEISCVTLQTCNETAALALATLSVGDFLLYAQDCKSPPDVLVDMVRSRICEKVAFMKADEHLQHPISKFGDAHRVLHDLEMWDESSDEESEVDSPTGPHDLSRKWFSGHPRAARLGYSSKGRTTPIFCRPQSSLIAVIVQVLAHREHYIWVTKEDDSLVGIVTLQGILTVLLNHLSSSS